MTPKIINEVRQKERKKERKKEKKERKIDRVHCKHNSKNKKGED